MDKIYTDWSLRNIIGSHGNAIVQHREINARYQETMFTFNQPELINGAFHTFTSPNMEVSLMKMQLQKAMVFRFDDGIRRVGATLLLEGDINAACMYDKRNRPVVHSQHMFCYSRSYCNEYTLHAGNIKLLHINYKPEFLATVAGDECLIQKLFNGIDPDDRCVSIPLSFTSQTGYHRITHEMSTSRFNNGMQHLFMEAKAMELLSCELQELLCAGQSKPASGDISKADQERLFAAHAYIKEHYSEELSLNKLALKFGLNEFKLKKGYKQLFHTTVFDHIFQLRMQEARCLLQTGEHSVADVAYMVGYSSPNNFATAFQRMFKYPPSHVMKKGACALLCA